MTNAIEGFAGLDALIHGESLAFQDRAVVASANTTTPLTNAVQPTATDPLSKPESKPGSECTFRLA